MPNANKLHNEEIANRALIYIAKIDDEQERMSVATDILGKLAYSQIVRNRTERIRLTLDLQDAYGFKRNKEVSR